MNEQDLKNYVNELLAEGPGDWDGFDLEELAVKHGLLIPVTRHQPCPDGCECALVCNDEDFARGVECYDKADYLFVKASEYTRPNITQKMRYDAEKSARELLKKYGYGNAGKIVGALAVENMRLVAEINEHRAARGIDPLPTFEV